MVFLIKKLKYGFTKKKGRNGLILVRTKGGNIVKKVYRFIDFRRCFFNIPGLIISIEHDSFRSSMISLVSYANGFLCFILAPANKNVGSYVESGVNKDYIIGNNTFLSQIPLGARLHNLEIKPGKGGQFARSGGSWCTLMSKDSNSATIRFKNNIKYNLSIYCMGTLGQVSKRLNWTNNWKKAGKSRKFGIKPVVRGIAMNPVDHPNGGRTNGGKVFKTLWGKIAKGIKTKKNRKFKTNNNIILNEI